MRGPIGEVIFPWSVGKYWSAKKPQITLTTQTLSLPSKLKIPPIPAVKEKVIECLRIKRKPLMAAVQKFSPVSAT